MLESYGISDIGIARKNNEDAWGQLPDEQFFVLADGLGGANAGEIAAQTAVDLLCRSVQIASNLAKSVQTVEDRIRVLQLGIEEAHSTICRMSVEKSSLSGMGTTICCLSFFENSAICAHVGDSRIYRLRSGKLERLTEDHSLANDLLKAGLLKEENLRNFSMKHIVTRALGGGSSDFGFEGATISTTEVDEGDIYMICSDGLTDYVVDEEIQKNMLQHKNLEKSCQSLIELAEKSGSQDNITIVMVRVK